EPVSLFWLLPWPTDSAAVEDIELPPRPPPLVRLLPFPLLELDEVVPEELSPSAAPEPKLVDVELAIITLDPGSMSPPPKTECEFTGIIGRLGGCAGHTGAA